MEKIAIYSRKIESLMLQIINHIFITIFTLHLDSNLTFLYYCVWTRDSITRSFICKFWQLSRQCWIFSFCRALMPPSVNHLLSIIFSSMHRFLPVVFFFNFLAFSILTLFILIDPGFDISKTHVFHCVLFPRRFHYISVCPLPQSHFVFFIFSFDCLIIDRHSSHAHVIPVTARLKRKRGVGGWI